jgi:acylphosphatase
MAQDEDDIRTVTVRIAGRVQNVYYRAWTDQTARALGLHGWVRNHEDGSVQAVFSGPPEAVAEMLRLCEEGSPDAVVESVTVLYEGGTVEPVFKVLASDNWQKR